MKEGSKYFHTYSNKVFGGWDMCIDEDSAAKLQTMRFVKEVEVRLNYLEKTAQIEGGKKICLLRLADSELGKKIITGQVTVFLNTTMRDQERSFCINTLSDSRTVGRGHIQNIE